MICLVLGAWNAIICTRAKISSFFNLRIEIAKVRKVVQKLLFASVFKHYYGSALVLSTLGVSSWEMGLAA